MYTSRLPAHARIDTNAAAHVRRASHPRQMHDGCVLQLCHGLRHGLGGARSGLPIRPHRSTVTPRLPLNAIDAAGRMGY